MKGDSRLVSPKKLFMVTSLKDLSFLRIASKLGILALTLSSLALTLPVCVLKLLLCVYFLDELKAKVDFGYIY